MNSQIKSGNNYVDNNKLYESFVTWYAQCEEAVKQGKDEPQPPKYISECIMLIPKHLASKGNFSGYSFKDEMISDAIENIILYLRNFDINKSKNPFAYFTQIAYFAFLRRIIKEKQQSYVKYKLIQNSGILDKLAAQEQDKDDIHFSFVEMIKMNLNPELEEFFNEKKKLKHKKKTKKTIEDFLMEDSNAKT